MIHAYVSCVLSHLIVYAPVGEKKSGVLLCFAVRDIALCPTFFSCCRPPPTSCHDHRQYTAAHYNSSSTLPLSLASFNCQAFLMDPLSRSPAKRSKTAEVVESISCERTLFHDSHICKLCVIPRSRVAYYGMYSVLNRFKTTCTHQNQTATNSNETQPRIQKRLCLWNGWNRHFSRLTAGLSTVDRPMPETQQSSCCGKDVELAPMQMPSRILGAMYHAPTSSFVLPAVVAHAPSPRPSRELQAKRLVQKNKKSNLAEVSHVC